MTMLANDEFNKCLEKISLAWAQQDFDLAYKQINLILHGGTNIMKGEAKLLEGLIKQGQKLTADARQAWSEGLPLAKKGTYLLYMLEQHIGLSYEEEGLVDDAIVWYRTAIGTCVEGGGFSGDQALTSFLMLNGGRIPPRDIDIVTIALRDSWQALELSGEPDTSDLPKSILELAQHIKLISSAILDEL